MAEWHPFPKQETALERFEFEVLFGGARGPGKTDTGIVWLLGEPWTDTEGVRHKSLTEHPMYRALVIRKNATDLTDWLDRAQRFFAPFGGVKKSEMNTTVFVFPSGAKIRTGHLKDADTYTKYQGHEYQRMLIEEATQIPFEKRYLQLTASCRSTVPEISAQVFLTANPGEKGHAWVKGRFIDVAPYGQTYRYKVRGSNGTEIELTRIYIPATMDDNPVLMRLDPTYIARIDAIKETDPDLWKAWRHGDWDIFVGQVFREWKHSLHVTPHPNVKRSAIHTISYDWGYNDMGCAIYSAFDSSENKEGVRHAYTYREIYQNMKDPEQWAKDMAVFIPGRHQTAENNARLPRIEYVVLPFDCFDANRGSQSIAKIFASTWISLGVGTYIRKGQSGTHQARINRQATTHRALSVAKDGVPYWQVHPRCSNLIRTLPSLAYDENDHELVDTDMEDHAFDAGSLGLLTERVGEDGGAVKMVRPGQASAHGISAVSENTYQGEDILSQMLKHL